MSHFEETVHLDVSTAPTVLNIDVTEETVTVDVEVNTAPEVLTLGILEVGPPGPTGATGPPGPDGAVGPPGPEGRRHLFHSPTQPVDLQSGDVWIETGLDEPVIWLKA